MRRLLAILSFLIIPSPAFSIDFSGLDDIHDNDHVMPGQPVFYYHCNSQGSVGAITAGTLSVEYQVEDIVERYTYSMLGEPTIYDPNDVEMFYSEVGNKYKFQGRRFEPNTNLYYFRNRYYNFATGEFMTPDPARTYGHGTETTYEAFGGDGWNWQDPFGLDRLSLDFYTHGMGEIKYLDKLWGGFPKEIKSLDDLLAQVKAAVGDKFDPTGECGNCVNSLTLMAHSGVRGFIQLGDENENITNGQFSDPTPEGTSEIKRKLTELGKYFCKGATMTFIQCDSGKLKEGTRSLALIAKTCNVTAIGFLDSVRAGFTDLVEAKSVSPEGEVTLIPSVVEPGSMQEKKKRRAAEEKEGPE